MRINLTMSSITATPQDTERFLALLEAICKQQTVISRQLDELLAAMTKESEPILSVLERLVSPIDGDMAVLVQTLRLRRLMTQGPDKE